MTAITRDDYDEVLYPGYAYPQTHPDRLATIATLFGMTTAPIERARVLELACGDGANLIPMAMGLPESRFTGVDLSARAVAKGREMIAALSLNNIALHRLDLMNLDSDFGEFDYIIAHGLYSWVSDDGQDRILDICDANLAASGVAYVSYNAYPGCHLRQMLREMMLFHVQAAARSQERINQALAFTKFLADSESNISYLLDDELDQVIKRRREVLFHDDLAEVNSPVYFYQFVQRAARHGLQYLAEADFFDMEAGAVSEKTLAALAQFDASQLLVKEQYMDFLKCRRFRQTLLCHHEIPLNRSLDREAIKRFYVASSAPPVSAAPDIRSGAAEDFRTAKGTTVEMDHPLSKAALTVLSECWPRSLGFDELMAKAQCMISDDGSQSATVIARDGDTLAEMLLKLYAADVVEFRVLAPKFAAEAGQRPRASRIARLQARSSPIVTNLCHLSVRFEDELSCYLLMLLDGSRDRAQLLNELKAFAGSNNKSAPPGEKVAGDAVDKFEVNAEMLEKNLARLARLALLEA